jgi:CAP-Gly domain-containing linker protein 1
MYPQDELESEIERLKERLTRSQKKSSKTELPEDSRSSVTSTSTLASHVSPLSAHPFPVQPFPTRPLKFSNSDKTDSEHYTELCEICERPGHDIFTCDLLKDDHSLSTGNMVGTNSGSLEYNMFCDDCEERGHLAANCPHSMDVF